MPSIELSNYLCMFANKLSGLFPRIKSFFVGEHQVEAYGGNKGGYNYIIFVDKASHEVLRWYVSAPTTESKTIDGGGSVNGISGKISYQVTRKFTPPFAVTNAGAKSPLGQENLEVKMSQGLAEASNTYNLQPSQQFVVGSYSLPVAPEDPENPTLEPHFGEISEHLRDSLDGFCQFVIDTYWGGMKTFRSSIFLHDAITKQMKMRAEFNMKGYVDYMIAISDGKGTVGAAVKEKTPILWDGNIVTHEERGVDSKTIWKNQKSILAIPILDGSNIPLGALAIDSDKNYAAAKFGKDELNRTLTILTGAVGRLLEAYT